jgi:hypothetical protein
MPRMTMECVHTGCPIMPPLHAPELPPPSLLVDIKLFGFSYRPVFALTLVLRRGLMSSGVSTLLLRSHDVVPHSLPHPHACSEPTPDELI